MVDVVTGCNVVMVEGWCCKIGHSVKILGIIGQHPSVSKFNWLDVDIFEILVIYYQFEVYFVDSSKMISNFPKVLNFKRLFLKNNHFVCN